MKKSLLAGLTALMLLLACVPLASAAGPKDYLGKAMPDFTVTTAAGETFTLSEVLKEKKAVLVNFWATWCYYCEVEFPYLEEAYEQYRDQVEVIALSTEPTDTAEKMAAYAAGYGLTFPVANDGEAGLSNLFATSGIPTSVAVDRFGNVTLIEVGAQSSAEPFLNLFEMLTGDDYTETAVLNGFPKSRPTVAAEDESILSQMLGLPVANSDNPFAWPFLTAEVDGKACVKSSNAGHEGTVAELMVMTEAKAGDVFAFNIKVSTEAMFDLFSLTLNGETVKYFGGEKDWFSYAVALADGANEIILRYEKDEMEAAGEDAVYLADFALLSGEEAQAALAANPAYPFADETSLTLLNEDARQVVFDDSIGALSQIFGEDAIYYLVNGYEARFAAALSEGHDPESVVTVCNADNSIWTAWELTDGPLTASLETGPDSEAFYFALYMQDFSTGEVLRCLVLMPTEEDLETMEATLTYLGYSTGYTFAEEAPAEAVYTVRFIDQNGDPVAECGVTFCTDTTCNVSESDENGVATFTGAPYPYHIQVVSVPDGYDFDTDQEFTADETGCELTLTVTKE